MCVGVCCCGVSRAMCIGVTSVVACAAVAYAAVAYAAVACVLVWHFIGMCADVACSVEETASGAVHVHMKPGAGSRASNPREGSIVVLTLSRPPPKGALEWARGRGPPGGRNTHGPAAKRQRFGAPYLTSWRTL